MGQFFEYLKISFKSIWDNKMRSVLTMFVIIVGISSVIAVVALGNGIKGTITGAMDSMFASQVYIKAGTTTEVYEDAIMNPRILWMRFERAWIISWFFHG